MHGIGIWDEVGRKLQSILVSNVVLAISASSSLAVTATLLPGMKKLGEK